MQCPQLAFSRHHPRSVKPNQQTPYRTLKE